MMQVPCAVKVARTVLSGGKVGDDIKGLPIAIIQLPVGVSPNLQL